MRKRIPIVAFVFSAIISGGVTYSAQARAGWTRRHAVDCVNPVVAGYNQATIHMVTGYTNDSNGSAWVGCPLSEASGAVDKQYVTGYSIYGHYANAGTAVQAQACITYYNTNTGGQCGTQVSSGLGQGEYALSVPISAIWTAANESHFGYVQVLLPGIGLGISTFRGALATSNP